MVGALQSALASMVNVQTAFVGLAVAVVSTISFLGWRLVVWGRPAPDVEAPSWTEVAVYAALFVGVQLGVALLHLFTLQRMCPRPAEHCRPWGTAWGVVLSVCAPEGGHCWSRRWPWWWRIQIFANIPHNDPPTAPPPRHTHPFPSRSP